MTTRDDARPVDAAARDWGTVLAAFARRETWTLFLLGIVAGLPLLLVFATLSVWLTEAGVPRRDIPFFSWVALAYAFKVVWAPLIDRLPVPVLSARFGRRRGWLLVAQGGVLASLIGMAGTDPAAAPVAMALWATALAFSSASQDIVIDAYRIEIADPKLQGMLSAAYIAGYRVGMLIAGAGALEIAGVLDVTDAYDRAPWMLTYLIMAGAMGLGVAVTLLIREPAAPDARAAPVYAAGDYLRFLALFVAAALAFVAVFFLTGDARAGARVALAGPLGPPLAGFLVEALRFALALGAAGAVGWGLARARLAPRALVRETYVAPFAEFLARHGRVALVLLAVIAVYRIADVVMGVMANVFYVELGFEKQEIGRVTKAFGLVMTLLGGFLGGVLVLRHGIMPVLMLGAVLAAGTNVLFAGLAALGPEVWGLAAVIAADNLSAGIASASFVAYLSALTNRAFTAVQYALFSSLMLLLPKLVAGYSGMAVDALGYQAFFIGTALLGLPVLGLLIAAARLAPVDR